MQNTASICFGLTLKKPNQTVLFLLKNAYKHYKIITFFSKRGIIHWMIKMSIAVRCKLDRANHVDRNPIVTSY